MNDDGTSECAGWAIAELGTTGSDVYEPDGDSAPDAGWKYGLAAKG